MPRISHYELLDDNPLWQDALRAQLASMLRMTVDTGEPAGVLVVLLRRRRAAGRRHAAAGAVRRGDFDRRASDGPSPPRAAGRLRLGRGPNASSNYLRRAPPG